MNEHDFYETIRQMSSLRGLLTVWPPKATVDNYIERLEKQMASEAAEAEAEERRRLEGE